ncbi:MAG: hypothetical protein ACRDO1_21340 [Nocardioidaceae bacterium]
MSVVVEFCGLPGSGKSTVARHTLAALDHLDIRGTVVDEGISAVAGAGDRVRRRLLHAAGEAARHPICTVGSARRVALAQGSARDSVAGLAQWLAVQRLVARSRRHDGVHLVEEGAVQTLWTLGLRARRDVTGPLWAALNPLARADLLVMVDATVDVVVDRLARRESRHSRTQHLTVEQQRVELEHGRDLLERLVETSGLPVRRLTSDAGTDPTELAAEVATAVHDVRNGTGPCRSRPSPRLQQWG